jgi:hypothetical protein
MSLDERRAPPRQRGRQQLQSADDVAHIQALLHSAPSELGSVPSAAAAAEKESNGRRRRDRQLSQPRPPRPPRPAAAVAATTSTSTQPPDTSRFALPGPRSTRVLHHCEACDCFVPVSGGGGGGGSGGQVGAVVVASSSSSAAAAAAASSSSSSLPPSSSLPASWRNHVAGIRHSRASLGAAMSGGVPGAAVAVSIFEAPQQQQWERQRQQQQREPKPPQQQKQLPAAQKLQTECLKELLRHSGITDGGRELSRRFDAASSVLAFSELSAALARWERTSAIPSQWGSDERELEVAEATPMKVAALASVLSAGGGSGMRWWLGEEEEKGKGRNGDAAASPCPPLSVSLAKIHPRDLPALTASCSLLARSLATNHGLVELSIDGGALHRIEGEEEGGGGGEDDGEEEPAAAPAAAHSFLGNGNNNTSNARPWEQRLWGIVARELARSLRGNDTIRSLRLRLPRGHLGAGDAQGLRAAAAGAREARRRALLSAAHPRCCRGEDASPLSNLPMDLMVVIAGMGIREGACEVEVEEV